MNEVEASSTDAVTSSTDVTKLWNDVVGIVNGLLRADSRFGFSRIEANLNPSLDDILFSLAIIDAILTLVVQAGLSDHDETRQALNAQQCVLHIRRMAIALRDKDEDEYKKVMALLHSQAQF